MKFAGVDQVKSITIKGEVLSKEDFAKLNPASEEVKATTTEATAPVKTKTAATADEKKKQQTKN